VSRGSFCPSKTLTVIFPRYQADVRFQNCFCYSTCDCQWLSRISCARLRLTYSSSQEIVLPNGFYDAAIDMVYGKGEVLDLHPSHCLTQRAVVANSFLATLNSRKVLRAAGTRENGSTTDDSTDIPLSTPPATTIITGMFRVSNITSLHCCH
jgi:hypothetical protein